MGLNVYEAYNKIQLSCEAHLFTSLFLLAKQYFAAEARSTEAKLLYEHT